LLQQRNLIINPLCRLAELFCIERRKLMSVSYKKLWKLLIDKEMKKKELCAKAGISTSSLTKMGKNGHDTTEVLAKICRALDCTVDDIMEVIPE
jgi:DNA-binding Xre family transcriptional regulator